MHSQRASKLYSERPGSSAKVYDYKNSDHDSNEKSKIPIFPARTYSLEGKGSTCSSRKSSTRQKVSTTSMIPRLDKNKAIKKNTLKNNESPRQKNADEIQPKTEDEASITVENTPQDSALSDHCTSANSVSSLECKVNKDFANFKNNVLRIPEYWTDAGQTATNILKNAINIVSKQYPTVERQSFETEIQSILKATEAVKQQILTKTENIIAKATQIYLQRAETGSDCNEEDLKKITKKMQKLRNEVNIRKNVFGDLLKCGNEMKQLIELEKAVKLKDFSKELQPKETMTEVDKKESETSCQSQTLAVKNSRVGLEPTISENKKMENSTLQSCGDVIKKESNTKLEIPITDTKTEEICPLMKEEKTTQTTITWSGELHKREKNLNELNQQIVELQQLCKDHISKFKSFNLQIKLRGIRNKAQHMSVTKELQLLNDEKMQLEEKNSQLLCYNKDLETVIKQKDLDLHQKEKLINQQKKLLNVRDELIEMLKNRCNMEETHRY